MKKILMTGGGSAGHVTPNIALMKQLKEKGLTLRDVSGTNFTEEITHNGFSRNEQPWERTA